MVITFCLLKSLATNTTANESIAPFLLYFGGAPELTAQSIPILAEYDLLVMDRFRYSQVNGNTWGAIKAISPGTKIFVYQVGPFVADNTDTKPLRGLNNLGRYDVSRGSNQGSINKDHPDWFLKGSDGQRVTSLVTPQYFGLDYGNKDFAAYWAKHTLEDITFQEWRADGVFIDELGLCNEGKLKRGPRYVPVKYSNCQSWNKNRSDFIARVSTPLQQNNQLVMVNIGQTRNEDGAEVWRELGQRNAAPDIMHEEGAFAVTWGKGVVQLWPVEKWRQQIDLPSSVSRSVAVISQIELAPGQRGVSWSGETVSHSQIMRFATGSYLLARNASGPTTYFFFNDNRQTSEGYNKLISTERYDKFDIGVPVAKYEKKLPDQHLYSRKYTKGYVYVNPSKEKIAGIKAESDAEFSSKYSNARKVGADWYFDLKPHDAAILNAKTSTNANKPTTPPLPPVLREQ